MEAFQEHSTYSSAQFLDHLVKNFPMPIECVQTDNGAEFTNRFTTYSDKPTLFQVRLAQYGIQMCIRDRRRSGGMTGITERIIHSGLLWD